MRVTSKGQVTIPRNIREHAAVSDFDLVTRDVGKYRTYFPKVRVVGPEVG